jgi:3-deoxy-D-manno-octulosonic-acid transferase
MKLFYTLGVNFYTIGVRIASLWNPKAKKWIDGRKNVWNQLKDFKTDENTYWFHCASLGEFEQGRPIMEELKALQKCQIVISFFSPSGYENKKNFKGAELIVYLPVDSKKNAKRFLDIIQPQAVFIIKYEFWANYILTSQDRNIPIYSIAALFRRDQYFFTGYGKYMRKVLGAFTKIFVQNESSKNLLSEFDIDSVVCGDTRYDRVLKNAKNVEGYDKIKWNCDGKKVLICGSIWPEDLAVIQSAISNYLDLRVIIAPHELSDAFISEIEYRIDLDSIRYSDFVLEKDLYYADLIIIDNIGMLMNLYQYGDVAYIGGGFKTGLHNILEPAAFGLPVIFGNKHQKFPEAQQFIDAGIGFEVTDHASFERTFGKLLGSDLKKEVNLYMQEKTGATNFILQTIASAES